MTVLKWHTHIFLYQEGTSLGKKKDIKKIKSKGFLFNGFDIQEFRNFDGYWILDDYIIFVVNFAVSIFLHHKK